MKKFTLELHTDDFRGDHTADVVIVYEAREGETVEELVNRLLLERRGGTYVATDFIVIRPVMSPGKDK
jgi:hypothetical protein